MIEGAGALRQDFAIDTGTRLCAVIGHPVGHSLSPAMHNAAFQAMGLNYVYLAFDVADVGACLGGMRALRGFRGMSVTIPHKMAVMPHLDEVDEMARRVGCVNTVTCEDGRLLGTVTDGLGTLRAFADAGVSLRGRRILFTGAGGAVRAVAFAMADAAPEQITLLGRTPEKVASLAEDLRGETGVTVRTGALDDAVPELDGHDILVQGTPIGMHGHDEGRSAVPGGRLRPDHVVFDMVYRPRRTRLLEDARAAGCVTIEGLEMLLNQAALQFERWTGLTAPSTVMRRALESALSV